MVADRDREGIDRVIRTRQLPGLEQRLDHLEHLPLGGGAVPGDRELDLVWCVFMDQRTGLYGCKQNDAACLADGHCGAHVLTEEELFEGRCLRPQLVQQPSHLLGQQAQPLRFGDVGRSLERAAGDERQLSIDPAHGAVAGIGKAGIDATRKLAGEGYSREWPAPIVQDPAIVDKVSRRWREYGID